MTDPKRFQTLQAVAALAGLVLRAIRNDAEERWTFYLTAAAFTKELHTLDDVECWLERVTVTREEQSA